MRPHTLALRILRSRDGIAATEFSMILPLMALIFFGMLEASDLLSMKRKVENAAHSLVDLVSQEPTIRVAEVADSIVGVKALLKPADTTGISVRIVSLVRGPNPGDPVLVHWSLDQDNAQPYPAGSVYTKLDSNTTVRNEASLVVVEMDFQYNSSIGGKVFSFPFDFNQMAMRWPRKSSRVQLCQTSDPATCTS